MKSYLTVARVSGIELALHFSWLVIATLIIFSLGARFGAMHPTWGPLTIWGAAVITGLLFFVGLFAHELSHALVAKANGLPIRRITLFLLGGVAQIEKEPRRPGTEFWMAIAGPLASVAFGFICLILAWVVFGWAWWTEAQSPAAAVLVWLGYINLALAAFNLIPGFPMDGGRVLRSIVWRVTGNARRATIIAARTGIIVGWLFVAWGILRAVSGAGIGGLWMALIGWFLIQAAGGSLAQARAESLLQGLSVREVMSQNCAQVDADTNLQAFTDAQLQTSNVFCYAVTEGDRLAGMLFPGDIRRIARDRWPQTTVRAVMQPLEKLDVLSPETPATTALELLGRADRSQMPVVSGGFLQGIVSRNHLMQVLQTRADLTAA